MSKTIPVLLAILLSAAAILPAAAQSTSPINGVFDYDKAKKVVKNINNIWQSQGLRPLKMDASLTEAAMLRAAELAFQREGNGFYSWTIYLTSAAATKTDIPSGQWTVDVAIALKENEHTHVVTRTKSDTDLTPTSFEVTGHFNYDKAMEVMELVNKERGRRGLKPYFFDSTLTELAMIRSAEMKGPRRCHTFAPTEDMWISSSRISKCL